MATFAQGAPIEQTPAVFTLEPTFATELGTPFDQPFIPNDQADSNSPGTLIKTPTPPIPVAAFQALESQQTSGGFDWFEDFHVVARSYEFGNLLSDQSVPIEVFCSFRRLPQREWTSFVNNAGAGTSIPALPPLPTLMDPLSGIEMTLEVDANGAAFVDATLDFGFSGVGTIFVPIMIQRLVLWGLTPELPFTELLSFKTDVTSKEKGKEQRSKTRKSPRQIWDYLYKMDEGPEAQTLENLLFDFQARNFGVPVWADQTQITADEPSGVTTITVLDTANRDFRIGGFAVILIDQNTFDVLELTAIGPTSLDFQTPTTNAYSSGAEVFPLSITRATDKVQGARYLVNLREKRIRFTANNNDVDLADLTPYSSFDGKLLLDVGNVVRSRTVSESNVRRFEQLDGQTGLVFQDSAWEKGKRRYPFTMRAEGREEVWNMRGMAYAIAGRWKSFYVPTGSNDFQPVADLASGANTLNVTNVGYVQFVRNRQPKNVIRVTITDGTVLLRTIIDSSVIDPATEQLVLDANWPATYTPAQVARVEYVEKLRFDTDEIRLEHDPNGTIVRLNAPVVHVFD